MRIELTFRPGGEVVVSADGDDLTMDEGALGLAKVLRLLGETGRIPFGPIDAIESHRGHSHGEAISHGHRQSESE